MTRSEETMTHSDLVKIGFRWLKRRCTICFSEFGTYAYEIPDVIGWKGPNSVLIECKTSRGDFLADRRKAHRVNAHIHDDALGRVRYYLCPEGVIQIADLPENWGLLWVKNGRVFIQKEPGPYYFETDGRREIGFLVSMLRRVQASMNIVNLDAWIRENGHRMFQKENGQSKRGDKSRNK
jgi:hypothetical protein